MAKHLYLVTQTLKEPDARGKGGRMMVDGPMPLRDVHRMLDVTPNHLMRDLHISPTDVPCG
jgi:hypothetical protein